jgi:hypothetical protein
MAAEARNYQTQARLEEDNEATLLIAQSIASLKNNDIVT